MDDTQQDPQNQPQQTPPQLPPAPVAPVGGMNKEFGPVAEQPLAEVLQPTEKAPELSPEVVEAGVEVPKNPEVPDLTMHDKNAGISHAPAIAPVPTAPTGLVEIDVTQEQALADVKVNKDPKKSKSWLVLEILKMAQRKLSGGEH